MKERYNFTHTHTLDTRAYTHVHTTHTSTTQTHLHTEKDRERKIEKDRYCKRENLLMHTQTGRESGGLRVVKKGTTTLRLCTMEEVHKEAVTPC